MPAALAGEWADFTRWYSAGELIGFATVNHNANFHYRILPETKGVCLNYESVDICGGMSGYICVL